MLAKTQIKKIRKEQWAKELVADYEGKTYTENTKLKTPSESAFSEAFEDEFGAAHQGYQPNRDYREERKAKIS